MLRNFIVLLCILTINACTWVRLTKEGESVVVKTESEVTDCKRGAKTSATLRSKVMGIERNEEKVKEELETLGRNAAVEYGGNVIVPITEIKDGSQSFAVYQCQ